MDLMAVGHAVADADLGENVLRLDRVRLDLAADVRHVHTQKLVVPADAGPQSSFIMDL